MGWKKWLRKGEEYFAFRHTQFACFHQKRMILGGKCIDAEKTSIGGKIEVFINFMHLIGLLFKVDMEELINLFGKEKFEFC